MGVVIIAEQPPATSTYDNWRVYRATTKTGVYSLITTQAITDLTYFDIDGTTSSWYKICYYLLSTTTESPMSDPIQGETVVYTTPRKVESLLQLGTLTDSTNPSVQEIIEVINRVEDEIDKVTGHAWRTRYSGTISGKDTTQQYEYKDIDNLYEYHAGVPVYLNHRKVKTFSAAAGDALEFWNGSTWEDWLATKTEGRANDFWVDYDKGVLYLKAGYYFLKKPLGLRIKYRYGESYVDLGIENIATKMVAIDVLTGMDPRANVVQEGSPVMTHAQRTDKWQKEVETKLDRYKEWQVPSTTL